MPKTYTTEAIAKAIDARLVGRGDLTIARLVHPADARDAQDLALTTDDALLPLLEKKIARAAVISGKAAFDPGLVDACLIVDRPRLALAKLTNLFAEPMPVSEGVHPTAIIEPGVKLGNCVAIGAYVYVGAGAVIGDRCVIHPHAYIAPDAVIGCDALIHSGVRIGARVVIGDRFIVHFNTSIGADGFSFVTPQLGSVEEAKASGASTVSASNVELVRIASLGNVIIGDDVEIGANTSIDRGTIAATRIGNGTKIDNQVQVGHNVTIGENCLICGRVGIAGSAVIGDRVVLGGAAGVADHVRIGNDVVAMGMSGIAGHVQARTIVGGSPAMPRDRVVENMFNVGRVRQLIKKINSLTERFDAFQKDSNRKDS